MSNVENVNLGSNVKYTATTDQANQTKKVNPNTIFKEDGNLNRAEKKALRSTNDINLSRAEIRRYSKMEGGEAFLDKYTNIKGEDVKTARKSLALDFFVGKEPYDDIANEIKADLSRFGVTDDELQAYLTLNRLNYNRPLGVIHPDIEGGQTAAQTLRMCQAKDIDGNLTGIILYEGKEGLDSEDAQPTRFLQPEGEYFVDGKGKYYKYNAQQNVLSDYTTKALKELGIQQAAEPDKVEVVQKQAAEPDKVKVVQKQPENTPEVEVPKFSDIFAKNKKVNVDETGSNQRITSQNQWETNLVVPKSAKYNENGVPTKLAIELPNDYGSKNADGIYQKRYQTLSLVDAENNIYSDKAGVRQFKLAFDENGISLVQQNIDDKKVKDFLDQNTLAVQEKVKDEGLNDKQNKMEIAAQEEAQDIMTKLSDRNNSWETYTQIGTDIGHITGAHGLLEKLVDEQDITGIKTFNDLKPAIDGLMARVPESVMDTPEYQAVQEAIKTLAATPEADIKHNWLSQVGGDTDIRKLDRALMNLAKTHLAGRIQGTNHANNAFLVGGNGSVVISPDREKGVFDTDAKFGINGNNYYLYQERAFIDRTVDFQDVIEHQDDGHRDKLSLIRNDITGNNRYGEIKFNANRAAENGPFYFKNDATGERFNILVEDGKAYIAGKDESKILLEDILNGRVPMPDQTV